MSAVPDVRRRLLKANTEAWAGLKPPLDGKLDSSFRKNTAFVKKIKTAISQDQQKGVLKEIETLTLEKYLSELIVGVTDGLTRVSKPEDIVAAMEIVLALHQRFTDQFTPALLTWMIGEIAFENCEKDDLTPETARKQRNLLKLLAEFNFIGIFSTFKNVDLKAELPVYITKNFAKLEAMDIIVPVLNEAINKESIIKGRTLPIALSFLRRFHSVFLDSEPELFVRLETVNQLRKVYDVYTKAALTSYKDLSTKVKKLDKKIHKTSIQTGKIPEELTELQILMTKLLQEFKEACIYLSEVFNFDFQEDVEDTDVMDKVAVEIVGKPEDSLGCWDSIETKNFYTKLPVIEKQDKEQNSVETGGEKIRDFIERLYNVGNRQEVDEVASSFVSLNLLNKATNNRINKYFHETQEIAKLKLFSRFLAICSLHMPDVINDLVDYLDRGFRSQIYNNRLNFKNILFFCELIKFKLVPAHVIFHKIRKLTLNISDTNNIDILGVVYEQCARFLLQEPEYSGLMQEMSSLLKEKAKNSSVSINDKLAIKNMLAFTLPPPSVSTTSQEEEPLHPESEFIFFLIRKELKGTSSRVKKIVNLFLKANYLDPRTRQAIVEVLSKPDMVNFQVIPHLVLVLRKVTKLYPSVLPMVVDNIFEDIQIGLESVDIRFNRRCISQVRYLAALYNFQLIDWKPLNLLLYRILNTGHQGNQPRPNDFTNETDLPNNYFRISMCTELLEAIHILSSITIDSYQFMAYFEYYIFCKTQPLPIEVEFKINNVVEHLFPHGYARARNLRVALMSLQDIVKNKQAQGISKNKGDHQLDETDVAKKIENVSELVAEDKKLEDTKTSSDSETDLDSDTDSDSSDSDSESESASVSELDDMESDSDSESESESGSDDDYEEEDDDEEEDIDEDDDDDEVDDEEDDGDDDEDDDAEGDEFSDSENEEQMDVNYANEMDRRMDAEFDKEFLKIVLDSYEQNKIANHGKLNISIPSRTVLEAISSKPISGTENTPFKLLSKSGKKSNITQLMIPKSSKFNQDKQKRDEEQKTHRQRIIQLVENMENQKD